MSRISPGLLLIAFLGLLAGLAVVYVLKKNPPAAPKETAVVVPKQPTYLVASSNLPAGRLMHASDFMSVTLSAAQMKVKNWPPILMSDGRQIINRRLKVARKLGDPFPPDAFYAEDTEPDLSEELPPGMRAISVTVRSEGLPAKATPGSMVDLIFRTIPDSEANLPELTSTLLERVQILAIGNNATAGTVSKLDQQAREYRVTLAVSPTQALKLKATEGHVEFSLTLRSMADEISKPKPEQLTLADIFDLPEPEAPPVPFVAEIFRRGQRQTIAFDPNTHARLDPGAPPASPSVTPSKGRRPRTKDSTPSIDPSVQPQNPGNSQRLEPSALSTRELPKPPSQFLGVSVVQPTAAAELTAELSE